jgi:hypothetical protein
MIKEAQDYNTVKSASPEVQELIKELDEMIEEIEHSTKDPRTRLYLITRLLEEVAGEKKKRDLK